MTQCSVELRTAGMAYPRTCAVCGTGPCPKHGKRRVPWGSEPSIATVEQVRARMQEIERESLGVSA